MFKTKRNIVLAFALCGLLLPATASVKNPVERPCKMRGNITMVVNVVNPTNAHFDVEDWGEATHLGLYTSEGEGFANLATGQSEGYGIATAANGDQLFWHLVVDESIPLHTITWTGGTGRFVDATGVVIMVHPQRVITPGPDPGFVTITHTYTATGTITY
jgi:hypothetical protein